MTLWSDTEPRLEEGEQLEDLSPLRETVLGLWSWQSMVLSCRSGRQ